MVRRPKTSVAKKNPGDDNAVGRYYVTGARRQEFEAADWWGGVEFDWA